MKYEFPIFLDGLQQATGPTKSPPEATPGNILKNRVFWKNSIFQILGAHNLLIGRCKKTGRMKVATENGQRQSVLSYFDHPADFFVFFFFRNFKDAGDDCPAKNADELVDIRSWKLPKHNQIRRLRFEGSGVSRGQGDTPNVVRWSDTAAPLFTKLLLSAWTIPVTNDRLFSAHVVKYAKNGVLSGSSKKSLVSKLQTGQWIPALELEWPGRNYLKKKISIFLQ